IVIKDKAVKALEGKKGFEEEFDDALQQISQNDLAVFIFISTHTNENSMLTVDSQLISYSYLSNALSDEKRPDLKYLPKFMFIQGCSEDKKQEDVEKQTPIRHRLVSLISESNDTQFLCDTNTFFVTLCNKLQALSDFEIFDVLRKVELIHSNAKRYNIKTNAISLRKRIYLNRSSAFKDNAECYNYNPEKKSLCVVINNFTFKNIPQMDSSLRDM
ncbi:hypothetical protein B4U80_14624, partial [Leptotrombidium deliense]